MTSLTELAVRLDLVRERTTVQATTPRALFDQYAAFVWRTLKYQSVAERDLDDVSQEVFLVIYRKLPEYEGRGTVRAWIYWICIRVAADYRKRAHHRHEVLVSETPDSTVEPEASLALERSATRQELTALLHRLDEDKRAVLVLHEIENIPMTEIALIVECPLKTAYSRLAAARKQMLLMLSNRSSRRSDTMSTSRDDERLLDTLFEEAREAPRPDDLRRVEDGLRDWLAPDREPESPSAVQRSRSLSGGTLKAAAVVVAVAALVSVGVVSQTFRGQPAHRGDARPAAVVSAAAIEPSAPVPAPEVSVAVADLPSMPETPQSPPARNTPPRPRVVQVAPPSGPSIETAAPEAAETAESEASFLRRTRAALVAAPARALQMTEEHASRYPRGVLLQERDVIAIDALVRLGRRDEARARATAFHARYPSSAHESHLTAIIEAEPK